jgi:hypothetical protein
LMMKEDSWDEGAINQHYQAMRDVFRDDLDVEVKRRLRKRSQ